MINVKLGFIAAAFGFLVSLLVGLATGAGLFAFVRALIFAAFFFVLACMLYIAAGRFLPELLELSAPPGKEDEPGSRVNIALDGDVSASGMFGGRTADTGFDLNAPIPSAALDQLSEDGYTKGGAEEFSSPAAPEAAPVPEFRGGEEIPEGGDAGFGGDGPSPGEAAVPVALPEKGDNPDSVDVLPDFEAMSHAFLASTQEAEQGGGDGEPPEEDGSPNTAESIFEVSVSGQSREPSPYAGNKPAALEGDFQPKDVAQAIQTILKRE